MSARKITPRSLIHGVLDANSISKSTTKTSRTVRRRSARKSISSATPGTLIKGVLQTSSTAKKSPVRDRRVEPTPPPSSRRSVRSARRASVGRQNPTPRGLITGYLAATDPETPAVRVVREASLNAVEVNAQTDGFQGQFLQFISPDADTPDDVAGTEDRARRAGKRQRQTSALTAAFQSGVNRRVHDDTPSMYDSTVASPTLHSIPEEIESRQPYQANGDESVSDEDELEEPYQGPTQPQRPTLQGSREMPSQFEVPDTSAMSMNAIREVAAAETFQIHQEGDIDSDLPQSQSSADSIQTSQSDARQTGQSDADENEPAAKRSKLSDNTNHRDRELEGKSRRSAGRSFFAKEADISRNDLVAIQTSFSEQDGLISADEEQSNLRRSPRRSAGLKRHSGHDDQNSLMSEDGDPPNLRRSPRRLSPSKRSSAQYNTNIMASEDEERPSLRRSPRRSAGLQRVSGQYGRNSMISEDEDQPIRNSPRRLSGQRGGFTQNDENISEDEDLAQNGANREALVEDDRSSRDEERTPSGGVESARYGGANRSRAASRHSMVQDIENNSMLSEDGQENQGKSLRGDQSRQSRLGTPRSVREQHSRIDEVPLGPDQSANEEDEILEDGNQSTGYDVAEGQSVSRSQSRSGTPRSLRKQYSGVGQASTSPAEGRQMSRRSRVREPPQNEGASLVSGAEQAEDVRDEVVTTNRSRRSNSGTPQSLREQISRMETVNQRNGGDALELGDERPSSPMSRQGDKDLDGRDEPRRSRAGTPRSTSKKTPRSGRRSEFPEGDAGAGRAGRLVRGDDDSRGVTGVRGDGWVRDRHAAVGDISGAGNTDSDQGEGGVFETTPGLAEYLEKDAVSSEDEDVDENEVADDGYSPLVTPNLLPGRQKTPAAKTPAVLKERNTSTTNPATNKQKTAPSHSRKPRRKRVLPLSLTKSIFSHFCTGRVSRDAWDAIEDCSEVFFDRLSDDLVRYAKHGNRQTVKMEDAILLMKRQGLVTNAQSFYALVEKYLAMEYRRELIPCAQAGGSVMPEEMMELF